MDRITALREYLESAIGTMELNIAQHKEGTDWPYPGTLDGAKGKLQGYKEIYRIVGGS